VDEYYETLIPRKSAMTKEDLVQHIRTIGETIINDAEQIASNIEGMTRIEIEANITTDLTSNVSYRLQRVVLPKKGKPND